MMPAQVRVAVLGLSHDHIWENLDSLAGHPHSRLVAAADERPELLEKIRAYGCDRLYQNPAQLLDREKLDAVYVYSDNRHSADLAVQALERGLHVMLEKPMAADYPSAVRMVAAARTSKVQLMVNWPFIWWPSLQHALGLITNGSIGRVFQVHYRAAHAGPREVGCSPVFSDWLLDPDRNGSGVLMDYCSYGAALTCLLLGLPSRVSAVTSRTEKLELLAEDNAVVIMEHASAVSTSVGSWTQIGHMTSYEPMFYGTDGTIVVRHDSLIVADRSDESGKAVQVPHPKAQDESSAAFFIHHVLTGEPIEGICSSEVGLAAQQVLAASLISAQEGRTIALPLPTSTLR